MKKGAGLGSVTQRPDGRWWARGPRPERRTLGVWDTQPEAEAARREYVRGLDQADRSRMPGTTLRDYGERILAEREVELPRSARTDRVRWQYILRTPFIDDPIDTIQPPLVNAWIRKLGARLLSAGGALSLLRGICSAAVREGVARTNPCTDIKAPRKARTHEPWTYLLPDEQRALLAAPVALADRLWIACLMGTGIRDGELFALRLADIHLEDEHPHIVIRYGSPHAAPKGRRIRKVTLFSLALEAFRRWLPMLADYCPRNPHRLAFPGPSGGFLHSGHFLQSRAKEDGREVYIDRFRLALEAAGIVAEERHDGLLPRPHDLRHTFAASLVSGWWGEPWRLEDLRGIMGHRSITTTQRYAHLAPGRVQELARGVRVGYGVSGPHAIEAAKPALRALPPGGHRRTDPSSGSDVYPDAYGAGTPSVPHLDRRAALAGLEAIGRGDVDEARRLAASGWSPADLVRLFEAALASGEGRKSDVG